jgi:DnaJ family protein A protein 2
VQIDKGMQDKQKIVFQGEADQAPGTVPGDVVFVLQCKKHAKFLRKGDDLLMEHKVCPSATILPNVSSFKPSNL